MFIRCCRNCQTLETCCLSGFESQEQTKCMNYLLTLPVIVIFSLRDVYTDDKTDYASADVNCV